MEQPGRGVERNGDETRSSVPRTVRLSPHSRASRWGAGSRTRLGPFALTLTCAAGKAYVPSAALAGPQAAT